MEITQRQKAKSWELRAATSLAHLQQQGKKAEAQPMLSATYGWFTEGFDTKGLQEAKILLEELIFGNVRLTPQENLFANSVFESGLRRKSSCRECCEARK